MEDTTAGGMLAKGLTLLVTIGQYPDGITLSELARKVCMPVSTVHRLLATLHTFGFVYFDVESRRYSLGLRLFLLSQQVTLVRKLSEAALPVMRRVVEVTKETALISILDGEEMMYVERVDSPQPVSVRGSSGGRGPLYCTAMGKSLLAFQPEKEREAILQRLHLERLTAHTITDRETLRRELALTRERRYSIANEEHEPGVISVSVPVLDERGQALAALCVTAPAFRATLAQLVENVPLLRDGAREIAIQLPRSGTAT
ncbi:MAG: IclR family transcriptional regulator [Ktedonobacteraceae bacterium]|nr:IclR family transcriptional regulator [Ktedonobacteraceae bacterium]MBO0793205.1 IclR family transcriptional regulator [Ktedonobacteraceae bacterium]